MPATALAAAPVDAPSDILAVTSRRFRWTKEEGFSYVPGSEQEMGLNRTREGALARIDAHRTRADDRRRAFLATLFDEYEMATTISTLVSFEGGRHVVTGRRCHIRAAVVGD